MGKIIPNGNRRLEETEEAVLISIHLGRFQEKKFLIEGGIKKTLPQTAGSMKIMENTRFFFFVLIFISKLS